MANQLVSAAVLPRMFEIALHGRLDLQSLFDGAGIDAEAVGRADHYVTLDQVDALLSHAYGQVTDSLFGLRVGATHGYAILDLTGRLMASSATLEQAFVMLLRYKDLFAPHMTFELSTRSSCCTLYIHVDSTLRFTAMRLHGELIAASARSIIGSLLGQPLPLESVCFAFPEPDEQQLAQYRATFGCELVFEAPSCALTFASEWLRTPLPGAYPEYRRRLEQKALQGLRALSRAESLSQRVRITLAGQLGREPLTVVRVAAALNMTARTLQRRLRDENTHFAALRDQVRMEHACRALSGEACDKAALAAFLGFSDTANFYHAFKRWKGCAPEAYRRRRVR